MKRFISIAVLLVLSNVLIYSQYLRVPETIQEQNQWCWAGVSSCVLKYYGLNIAQCTIAEYTRQVATWHSFGTINCCTDANQGCNYWNYNWGYAGSIQDILQHWGVSNGGVSSTLSLSVCQTEINASRPFIFRWGWTSGGGHFLVGHGVDVPNSKLYYMDPWFNEGLHLADYSWVVQNSEHTWTHTNKISTNPTLPSVPVLVFPPNNSSNQPMNLTFVWRKIDRVTNYKFLLSIDSNFTVIVVNDSTLTDTLKTVSSLGVNTKYYWRVCGKNSSGNSQYSLVWNFRTQVTAIQQIGTEVPQNYALYNNYPNPFNPVTKIKFSLPFSSKGWVSGVQLLVYDVRGREVQALINEQLSPGTYEVEFDASNLPSGVYFYRLIASDPSVSLEQSFSETKRMILIK